MPPAANDARRCQTQRAGREGGLTRQPLPVRPSPLSVRPDPAPGRPACRSSSRTWPTITGRLTSSIAAAIRRPRRPVGFEHLAGGSGKVCGCHRPEVPAARGDHLAGFARVPAPAVENLSAGDCRPAAGGEVGRESRRTVETERTTRRGPSTLREKNQPQAVKRREYPSPKQRRENSDIPKSK